MSVENYRAKRKKGLITPFKKVDRTGYCFIGIDPAFRKSGFAVAIIDEVKELRFKVFNNGFLDFMKWINEAIQ